MTTPCSPPSRSPKVKPIEVYGLWSKGVIVPDTRPVPERGGPPADNASCVHITWEHQSSRKGGLWLLDIMVVRTPAHGGFAQSQGILLPWVPSVVAAFLNDRDFPVSLQAALRFAASHPSAPAHPVTPAAEA